MHRSGGGLQLLGSEVAGPAEVALQQFPVGALVGDPVALPALLRLATCCETACTALKGKGGNAGQPREPFLALWCEREGIAEDSGEGSVLFSGSYCVGRSVGAPGQGGCGHFRHPCITLFSLFCYPTASGRACFVDELPDLPVGDFSAQRQEYFSY